MLNNYLKIFLLLFVLNNGIAQTFAPKQLNAFGLMPFDTIEASIQINFADMDGDGDLDAVHSVLGDFIIYDSTTIYDVASNVYVAMQENVGDAQNPSFAAIDTLDLGVALPNAGFIASFEDITADGKPDIIASGDLDSVFGFYLIFFENTSTGGDISFTRMRADSIGLPPLPEGAYSPEFVDLNLDGDVDILISGSSFEEDSVAILFFGQNKGNLTDPRYTGWFQDPYNFSFIEADTNLWIHECEAGDLDNDGDIDLVSWSWDLSGKAYFSFHENIAPAGGRPDYSSMPRVLDMPDTVFEEGATFFEFVDIDGDNDLDIFISGDSIHYYENISCFDIENDIVTSICQGDAYTVGTSTYTLAGMYSDTLTSAKGCDSIVNLDLTVNTPSSSSIDTTICEGDIIKIGNNFYSIPGSYTETIKNTAGCDSSISLKLSLTTIDTAIVNQSGLLQVAEANATTYQWFDCTTLDDIIGANQRSFNPTASGSYAVRITKDGCEATSSCIEVIISSSRQLSDLGIDIYPNPVKERLWVVNPNSVIIGSRVTLIDNSGKRSYLEISDFQDGIHLSPMNAGFYTLVMHVEDKPFYYPLIILP